MDGAPSYATGAGASAISARGAAALGWSSWGAASLTGPWVLPEPGSCSAGLLPTVGSARSDEAARDADRQARQDARAASASRSH
jgi:hypothetical protein